MQKQLLDQQRTHLLDRAVERAVEQVSAITCIVVSDNTAIEKALDLAFIRLGTSDRVLERLSTQRIECLHAGSSP